jgi:uncharacterized membrane protein
MTPDAPLNAIYHAIQLAIAPVFLLTAIGTFLNALTGRLARAVDRRRQVEELLPAYDGGKRESMELELKQLQFRTVLILRAIASAVISALFVCLLIGTAFADAFSRWDLARIVAWLFVFAVMAFTASLLFFMREVWLAAHSVHPKALPYPPFFDDRSHRTAAKK